MTQTLHKGDAVAFIDALPLGPMNNLVYVIGNRKTHSCIVIDPAWDPNFVLQHTRLRGLHIDAIALTHSHHDHVNGVDELQKNTGAHVFMSRREVAFSGFKSNKLVCLHDEKTTLGSDFEIEILATPGHTPGSICFYLKKHKWLVTGDTLFVDGCGRCDMRGGDVKAMYQSLCALKGLPDETTFFGGHDYGSSWNATLGQQKFANKYLVPDDEKTFTLMRQNA